MIFVYRYTVRKVDYLPRTIPLRLKLTAYLSDKI